MIKIEEISTLKKPELSLLFEAFELKWQRLVKPFSFEKFCQLYDTLNSKEQLYRVYWNNQLAGIFAISGDFSERKVTYTGKRKWTDWRWYIGSKLLDDHIATNECYVSFITIAKEFRGKGIGTACLRFIENYAVDLNDIDKVTLFVAVNNHKAVTLYQANGFKVTAKVNSLLTRYFVNERSWIKMVKKL